MQGVLFSQLATQLNSSDIYSLVFLAQINDNIFIRIFCSNLHYNENAARKQAQTLNGELKWSIQYPKANKGEKAVARPLKQKPTYGTVPYLPVWLSSNLCKCLCDVHIMIYFAFAGYTVKILEEAMMIREQQSTLKKAHADAKKSLPCKPISMVEMYLEGKERPDKGLVISQRHSRFSKPAVPSKRGEFQCACKGKCATKKCICKEHEFECNTQCACEKKKCKNK